MRGAFCQTTAPCLPVTSQRQPHRNPAAKRIALHQQTKPKFPILKPYLLLPRLALKSAAAVVSSPLDSATGRKVAGASISRWLSRRIPVIGVES
jgi:hypothetical protein